MISNSLFKGFLSIGSSVMFASLVIPKPTSSLTEVQKITPSLIYASNFASINGFFTLIPFSIQIIVNNSSLSLLSIPF